METIEETKLETEKLKQSVIIQTSIQAGQANILAQKQFARNLYEGTGVCNCQLLLNPLEYTNDSNQYSLVCVLTDKPLKVTFTDKQNSIINLICNHVLVLDDYVSDLVIVNESDTEAATVSITKLK